MNMNEKPEHVRLAESISDGIPVDWQHEAPGPIADDPVVRQLRDLERLAAAHRGGAEARAVSPAADAASGVISGAAMSAALQGSAEPPLASWGTLRILELLGQGEFGEVFRAYDPALQQQVA